MYPVAVQVFALFRKTPKSTVPRHEPLVSIIVASRESDAAIGQRVANLLAADYPADRLEVVVGLDVSRGDEPPPVLPDAGRVRTVVGDAPGGKAANLNAAVRASRGEVLIFTDTAQQFRPDTIRRLVEGLGADPRLGALSGALELSGPASRSMSGLYWRYERRLRAAEAAIGSAVGVTGAVYAMPRRLWQGLPPGLILDDVYIPMRLVLEGHRIGFTPDAVAFDDRAFTPRQESRRKERTLAGVLQLCAWLPDVLKPWRNPIWVQFVMHKLARLLTPYAVVMVIVGLGVEVADALEPRVLPLAAMLGLTGLSALALLMAPVRRAVVETLLLLAATVRAPVHALRGNWDVWRR